MKKVVIVNCFETNENRVDLLYDYFSKKGQDVTVIQSDFKHIEKVQRMDVKENFIFVESKPYYKNISIARLTSHYDFTKKAFNLIEGIEPDLLYVIFPPNYLAKYASEYKRKNKGVKLFFDIMDLWPETMPVGKIKKLPPFTFWRLLRDNSLKYADYVITECDLYQKTLKNVLKNLNTKTVYLAKRDIHVKSVPAFNSNEIHLCYLGSINNIIDIPKIKAILEEINKLKPATLHIIGDGESKDILINEVKATGATVEYHGKIYDTQEKQDIFDRCQFGLNIMKDSVCVGLTMKSIDYFQHGLPIINNIKADTKEIVENHNTGFNIINEKIDELAVKITNTNIDEFIEMRKHAQFVFKNYFSLDVFNQKLNQIINN